MDQPVDPARDAKETWKPSTAPVDVDSFDEVMDDHPIVVVHYWADWDRLDRVMDRTLREVIPSFEEWTEFRSFDVDQDRSGHFARRSGVVNIPALACFLHGQRVETVVGLRSARELAARFEGWLAGIAGRPILYGPRPLYTD